MPTMPTMPTLRRSPRTGMRSVRNVALAIAATVAPLSFVTLAAPVAANAVSCTTITVIGVRGSGAKAGSGTAIHSGTVYGSGGLANVQTAASDINAGTTASIHYEGLLYPAAIFPGNPFIGNFGYFSSEGTGVANLRSDIEYGTSHCPSSKIVLLGLSQGAQVVGDVLDKTTGTQLSAKAKARIYAVGLFGDPEFKAGEPFNTGSMVSGQSGVWPRGKGNLSTFSSRIRSLCLKNDSMCQDNWGTSAGWAVHDTYADAGHQKAMATWVLTKV